MTNETAPPEPERVSCAVCLKLIPRSEAESAEARDYVAYFCGLDCYEKWSSERRQEPAPPAIPK